MRHRAVAGRCGALGFMLRAQVGSPTAPREISYVDSGDAVEQRSLLTAIATVIENREMPLHKYLMFHGEARLSPEDSFQVIEWTRAERTRLRTSGASLRQ